jgi:predicted dehydrogenase
MLAVARPQVVHVLTPPHAHVDIAVRAMEAGCHVVCEKPAAPSLDGLEQMLEVAERGQLRFIEAQSARFNTEVEWIDRVSQSGDLGEVREVDILLALDFVSTRFGDLNLTGPGVHLAGGAVHDFLPHLASLFLMFAGNPVDSVQGRMVNASGNRRVGFDQMDALVTAGDVRGRLRVTCDLEPSAFRLVVRGTRASIETDLYNPYLRVEGGRNIGKRVSVEHLVSGARLAASAFTNLRDKALRRRENPGLPRMLQRFYATLQDGTPAPVSFEQMRASADLVDRLVALGDRS